MALLEMNITKQEAFGSIVTSPVNKPTSENSSLNSLYFWLLSAFMGDVYITLCLFRSDIAIAYDATTVFPADVCADTYKNQNFSEPKHLFSDRQGTCRATNTPSCPGNKTQRVYSFTLRIKQLYANRNMQNIQSTMFDTLSV